MNHRTQQFQKVQHKRGFALLIGVLVAVVLISITYTMFGVSLKQLGLATSGKNSQLAFYAADTGAECALYADTKIDQAFVAVTTSIDAGNNTRLTLSAPGTKSTSCSATSTVLNTVYTPAPGNVTINGVTYTNAVNGTHVSTFLVYQNYPSIPSCAQVTVSKYKVASVVGGVTTEILKTRIESRGYNTCPWGSAAISNDPQRVERGLEIRY